MKYLKKSAKITEEIIKNKSRRLIAVKHILTKILFLLPLLIFLSPGASADDDVKDLMKLAVLGGIIAGGEAAAEAEEKRISEAPKLAPRLIPQANIQSQLGSYLVDQLYIKAAAEKNKQKQRTFQRDLRKIERDLERLDAGIFGWEERDYSTDLNQLTTAFAKHTRKYNDIVAVEEERIIAEQERLAAEEKARLEKLAAEEKARQERLASYISYCEGDAALSDDPFASFNDTQQAPRMDLVLYLGEAMKLQATKIRDCMWLGNSGRPDLVPTLIDENIFQQNPNNDSQYFLNTNDSGVTSIVRGKTFKINSKGRFVLDFEKYKCLFQKTDGSKMLIKCDDGTGLEDLVTNNPAEMTCKEIMRIFDSNRTFATQKLGMSGTVRYTECLLNTKLK